jgi:hypothetical protein
MVRECFHPPVLSGCLDCLDRASKLGSPVLTEVLTQRLAVRSLSVRPAHRSLEPCAQKGGRVGVVSSPLL